MKSLYFELTYLWWFIRWRTICSRWSLNRWLLFFYNLVKRWKLDPKSAATEYSRHFVWIWIRETPSNIRSWFLIIRVFFWNSFFTRTQWKLLLYGGHKIKQMVNPEEIENIQYWKSLQKRSTIKPIII